MLFRSLVREQPPAPPKVSGPDTRIEVLSASAREWKNVDRDSIAELETLIRRHPSSPEADYARDRLKKLPVVRPPPPTANPRQRILTFLNGEFLAGGHPWAPRVDFYGLGTFSREDVIGRRQQFFAQWPSRRYDIDNNSISIVELSKGRYRVSFNSSFVLQNGSKKLQGRGWDEIDLVENGGEFLITRARHETSR